MGTVEREHLLEALRETGWNIARAAARLGIPRDTLRYRDGEARAPRGAGSRRRVRDRPRPARRRERAPAARRIRRGARGHGSGASSRSCGPPSCRRRTATRAPRSPRRSRCLVEKAESFGGRVEELGAAGHGRGLRARAGRGRPAAGGPRRDRDPEGRRARAARHRRARRRVKIGDPREPGSRRARGRPARDRRGGHGAGVRGARGSWMAAAEPDAILVSAAAARPLERGSSWCPSSPGDATRGPALSARGARSARVWHRGGT